ncbi:MAG: hypothetical protein HQL24_10210 [Candidatus Omnitrophica bacterium]|nr:hypothetical protein [Candidatus Omnitrophota bacterium]
MTKKILTLAALTLLVSACSLYHVDSADLTTNYYPSKKSASDVVYMETVTRPYDTIGYVTVSTERRNTIEDVLGKMKREAAILGADAITDIKSDASGEWKKLPAQKLIGNAYIRVNFTATAIIFKDTSAQ